MGFIVERPLIIMSDSNGVIGIAKYKKIHDRSKHIDVRYHFAREQVFLGTIVLMKVGTDDNISDMFTKNLGKNVLNRLLPKMSVRPRN